MKDPTIFINGEKEQLEKALEIMTDDWVDDGNYCAQTVIDLRDALKVYTALCKHNLDAIKKLQRQIKKLREELKPFKAKEFYKQYE